MRKKVWHHKNVGKVSGDENLTETEVQRSLKHLADKNHCIYERIFDLKDYVARKCPECHAPIVKCNHCGKNLSTLGMVPPRQWADFRLIIPGYHVLIECKETNWKGKFPTHNVQEHQIEFLTKNVLAGHLSYLFICNRSRDPVLNCITIQDYLSLAYLPNGRMTYSIPMEAIDKLSINLPRLPYHGQPYYDLEVLFGEQLAK